MSMRLAVEKAQWTVLVYLNGDSDLESFALQDFREMAQVGSTDSVHIVTQFDRSGRFAATLPQWDRALRFRIEKGMEPSPANALMDLGEQNMGDGSILADFVRWGRETFPAERYLLVIWDHGQGWRVAESTPVSGTLDELRAFASFRHRSALQEAGRWAARPGSPSKVVPALSAQRTVAGGLCHVLQDDTSGDLLYNREIQDCLAGIQLDMVGFDACLMATVETAYAMRDIASVLVASEELQSGSGWNYREWLQQLTDNPHMGVEELGAMLVETYRHAYGETDPARTLSALRLNGMREIVADIDALATGLVEWCHFAPDEIITARRACAPFAPGYGMHTIDLAHFCSEIMAVTSNPSLKMLATTLAARIKASVIDNHSGAERQGPFGSTGMAIYFPETRALFNTDPDHIGYDEANPVYPLEFVQRHKWGTFLRAYYLRVL